MKVFLSHSTKDAAFVTQLAAAMTANGFEPWLCEVDVEKNVNFVAMIEEGLGACDVALLIWSPDAAASKWTTQEWTAVLQRELSEQRMRLGIVKLREHPLPELLRTKNYIRVGADEQTAIGETIDWLKHRETAQRLPGLKAPVYLPEYRPKDFVGRTSYLKLLSDMLLNEPTVFLLHGGPGAGKSMLALRFAWDAQKDFDAVIFQTCGQRSLDAITAELVERLPIDVKTQPPDKQREAAKDWLRSRQSLLVLDDVWSTDVKQLEPGPACSVLYTSRLRSLPGISSAQCSKVEEFSEAEAEELFHAYLDSVFGQQEVTQQQEALIGFARRVEMLPIAVAVGARLLREQEASALGRAVLKLRLDALADGAKDVNALFRTAIESQPDREQKLLAASAVCVQEGFWLPLAAQIAELTDDEAEQAASALVHGSLLRVLDRERQRFQIHALLRSQVLVLREGSALRPIQEAHAAALERLFKEWESRWQDCRECLEEIIPAAMYLRTSGEYVREAALSNWGFAVGRRSGDLDAALRIVQQEESSWTGCDDHEANYALLHSYGNQALILQVWGRLDAALALHKKEEAICLGLDNQDGVQASYGNQALILKARGQLEEAMALHKRQEEICLALDNQNGLQASYGYQALILKAWGRLEDAQELLEKREAICLELDNQNGLQASYCDQALVLKEWGRLEEALLLLKKQEAICLVLGNKNSLQRSYGIQGPILAAWGRLEESMALLKKQEAICLALGNKDSLQRSYRNQALILKDWGRLEEALALVKKQEAICQGLDNKSGLGHCYWSWGLLARAQGDKESEKQKLEQARALFTELKMPRERGEVQAELETLGG